MSRVLLKYRKISQGEMQSIYLVFNPAIPNIKGRPVKTECLNLEIYTNPRNQIQAQHNRQIIEIAECVRCTRYLQIVKRDFSFLSQARLDEDFLMYFRMNGDCHGAKYHSARLHFEKFVKKKCSFRDINASLCNKFRLYLIRTTGLHNKKRLSYNSACSYYNVFLSMVSLAYKDNILSKDFSRYAETLTWNHDTGKEFLSNTEIEQLANTPYDKYPELYTAGMLSIYTGIRRSDILSLQWSNVVKVKQEIYLKLKIKKTGKSVMLPLSLPAIQVLKPMKKDGKIFPSLTEHILNFHIQRWVKLANIDKHISFHCFRHTFAMQLLDRGVDIYTISLLLGHKQVSSTQNYAKITPLKMSQAIHLLDKTNAE